MDIFGIQLTGLLAGHVHRQRVLGRFSAGGNVDRHIVGGITVGADVVIGRFHALNPAVIDHQPDIVKREVVRILNGDVDRLVWPALQVND